MDVFKFLSVVGIVFLVIGCSSVDSDTAIDFDSPVEEEAVNENPKPELIDFKDRFGCYTIKATEDGVYLNDRKIESADAGTFVQVGTSGYNLFSYFEDKSAIYAIYHKPGCEAGLLVFPGANSSSLQVLNTDDGLAVDNNYVYKNGNVIGPAQKLSSYLSERLYEYDQYNTKLFENINGDRQTIIADASKLPGYPSLDDACGLNFARSLDSILVFTYGACGGGLFYYPVVSLDLNNLSAGFSRIENFYIDQKDFPKTKLLGIKENDGRELFLLDLEKDLVPYKVYEALPGERFFTPSHFGEDRINYTFLGDDQIILNIYAGVDKDSLPFSDEEETPIRQERLDLSTMP